MRIIVAAALIAVSLACHAQQPSQVSQQQRAPLPDCEWCGVNEAPRNLSSSMTIAGANEPGERLVITGRLLRNDGRTPAANVVMYAYHTNAEGIYPRLGNESGNARRHGYLRGWLRTDAQGRYRIESIRPGTYPSRVDPAHIHAVVGEAGREEQYITDFVFADDPLVNDRYLDRIPKNRGGTGVVTLTKRGGIWHGTRDIVLP